MKTTTLTLFAAGMAAVLCASCGRTSTDDSPDIRVSWDGATYQEIHTCTLTDGSENPNLYYPRAKRLSDGALLLSFEDDHYGFNIFTCRSEDGGRTWGPAVRVATRHPAVSTVGNDEKVYVNPDFIELSDGRIMLAYQWRYFKGYNDLPNTNVNCGIEIRFSNDMGRTWGEARNIYTGRCWEPAMLQLPSGEIQMYITSSQNVVNRMSCPRTVVIRSFDMGQTWQGKDSCGIDDNEAISHTRDERFGYDGMPSAVRLDDGTIAMPVEVWSGKYAVDQTPVVVRTTQEENWHLDKEKIISEGGPDYPAKKQLNKDFLGYGPYCTRLDSGEMIVLSNGAYKGAEGIWVFTGNRTGDIFTHATTPFPGYWGSVDYIGGDRILATGTVKVDSTETGIRGFIRLMQARVNRPMTAEGDVQMCPVKEFDRTCTDWWFLGKKDSSCVYDNFGTTKDSLVFATYLFSSRISAFTVENSDASGILIARGKDVYKLSVNGKGAYTLYVLEKNSWHLVQKSVTGNLEVAGTVNKDRDKDIGFCAKVCIPWEVLGGKLRREEVLRIHPFHMYKYQSKEKPFALFEELEGENSDYPCEWLSVTFRR